MDFCKEYKIGKGFKSLCDSDYYFWDCAPIAENGKYYLFSSRWDKRLGFGWNWLYNSAVCRFVADTAKGPYRFDGVVLPRRGKEFFDGMNTHNTCIKKFGKRFYLYYMGTTYPEEVPENADKITPESCAATWNRKRIGVAVADSIDGEFVRRSQPLLMPRESGFWDCTCTTNPTVAILPSGKTYMIYKSRASDTSPLQLGVAVADMPDGQFERLSDEPIKFVGGNVNGVEDPCLWYDEDREKFCLIAKDDFHSGTGVTGKWGSGFYAESDDCITFTVGKKPLVYTREVLWEDGSITEQCNLERVNLLFEQGKPTRIFWASGNGSRPYDFEGETFIISCEIKEK